MADGAFGLSPLVLARMFKIVDGLLVDTKSGPLFPLVFVWDEFHFFARYLPWPFIFESLFRKTSPLNLGKKKKGGLFQDFLEEAYEPLVAWGPASLLVFVVFAVLRQTKRKKSFLRVVRKKRGPKKTYVFGLLL